MYSESDIEAAVQSGAISREAAAALRDSVARDRAAPAVDEESFRLVTGFNDIFVSIAAVLLLVAVGWIGASVGWAIVGPQPSDRPTPIFGGSILFAGLFVAGASWLLAEYFTRRRRMALPSILLLLSFGLATSTMLAGLAALVLPDRADPRLGSMAAAAVGLLTAGAIYLHWRRFRVPITIAALTGALVLTLVSLFLAVFPAAQEAWLWVLLVAGIGVFAFAMWWDMSDRERVTRRSDVAFWLHLAAAPMLAHPVFNLLDVMRPEAGLATGLVVILLYLLFGVIALAVDRRALLVSSLVYVLAALAGLFRQAGAVGLNVALTALVIGSALLMLSAFWHDVRRRVVLRLPAGLAARLPVLDRPAGRPA